MKSLLIALLSVRLFDLVQACILVGMVECVLLLFVC